MIYTENTTTGSLATLMRGYPPYPHRFARTVTGKTVARLNSLKADLGRVVEECSTLGRDIKDKEAALEQFEEEFKHA